MSSTGAVVTLLRMASGDTIPEDYTFQCAPLEEFAVETAFEHTDFMTVGAGEFSRPQGKKLRTVSFETLIVPDQPSWAAVDGDVPALSKALVTICQNGLPFLLSVTESGETLVEMYATMRTLRLTDKAGEPGTKYVSVAFTEYRGPVLTDDSGQPGRPGKSGRVPNKLSLKYDKKDERWWLKPATTPPSLPKPKKGQKLTLRAIALAFYRDQEQFRKIRDANDKLGGTWGGSSDLKKHPVYGNGKKHQLEIPE